MGRYKYFCQFQDFVRFISLILRTDILLEILVECLKINHCHLYINLETIWPIMFN